MINVVFDKTVQQEPVIILSVVNDLFQEAVIFFLQYRCDLFMGRFEFGKPFLPGMQPVIKGPPVQSFKNSHILLFIFLQPF